MSKNLEYRPDIDGLRAIAVMAVLFYHADLGVKGGFLGVDVFFVISGYLITGLILKDLESDGFQLLEFWGRRVRRILPALFVVVLASLTAGWFILIPIDYRDLGQSVVAQALLTSNIYFWSQSDYFASPAETMPLLHTWSLAVEEQFYMVFPFILIALHRFSRTAVLGVTLMLCLGSFGLSVYCDHFYRSTNFYFLPPRAWELLIGALLAMVPARHESPLWLKEFVAWTSLLSLFLTIILNHRLHGPPGSLACASTVFLIWANCGRPTSVGKLLALPPLVFIGLISYSLYLWHWPILVLSKCWALNPLSIPQRLLLLVVSMVLAVLSWKWVETPFRKRALLRSRVQIFSFAGITSATLVLLGFAISELQGIPWRLSAQVQKYANGSLDLGILKKTTLKDVIRGHFIELGNGNQQLAPKVFVWGDSHAMHILSVLDALCREHNVRGLAATHPATLPLLEFESHGETSLKAESIPYNHEITKFIQKSQVHDVVLVARWSVYGENVTLFRDDLSKTIRALNGAGARVWIMQEVPQPMTNVPRCLARYVLRGGRDPEGLVFAATSFHANSALEDQLFRGISSSQATLLDPSPFFYSSAHDRLIVQQDGKPLYYDDNHLSGSGADKLRPLFEPIIANVSQSK